MVSTLFRGMFRSSFHMQPLMRSSHNGWRYYSSSTGGAGNSGGKSFKAFISGFALGTSIMGGLAYSRAQLSDDDEKAKKIDELAKQLLRVSALVKDDKGAETAIETKPDVVEAPSLELTPEQKEWANQRKTLITERESVANKRD